MAPVTQDPAPGDESRVEDALRELRLAHSAGAPDGSLEDRVLAQVETTRQRRRPAFVLGGWPSPWPTDDRIPVAAIIGAAGFAAVLLAASLGMGLFVAHPSSSSPLPLGASAIPSAQATDAPAVNAPHVAGTCPVTPITRIAGGAAPEVDVSGLRWRWGGQPWVAKAPQKVVWLADVDDAPALSVFATQLDRPIILAGQTVGVAIDPSHPVYPLASDVFVDLVLVPDPGCWLLTAVWPGGASSVVVAVAPPASPPSPAPGPSSVAAPGGPLRGCPATPASTTAPPAGWPGLAYDDGPLRWLLPPTSTWRIGGTGDKLVVASVGDWGAKEGEVVALPVAEGADVGRIYGSSVAGDLPKLGSGTLGVGLTLPTRDCWAIVYLDATTTSTVVTDLSQIALPLGSGQTVARLRVNLVVKPIPEPSGIVCTCPDNSTYVARVFTAAGKEVATWNLRDPAGLEHSLEPGTYSLVVSRVFVTDNVDTGARTSSTPFSECSTDLTIAPSTTASLTAIFALGSSACELDGPRVMSPHAMNPSSGSRWVLATR